METINNINNIVTSKQSALSNELEHISNNLSNLNTTGFKKDFLINQEHRINGTSFASDTMTLQSNEQGPLKNTGRNLDIAILQKNFYFTIITPNGLRFTRNGHINLDSEGFFVNEQGYKFADENGNTIQISRNASDIYFSRKGDLAVDGAPISKIGIHHIPNPFMLSKVGYNLMKLEDEDGDGDVTSANDNHHFQISQGSLEASNVNSISETTDLIQVNRTLEAVTKLSSDGTKLQLKFMDILSNNGG